MVLCIFRHFSCQMITFNIQFGFIAQFILVYIPLVSAGSSIQGVTITRGVSRLLCLAPTTCILVSFDMFASYSAL